METAVVKTGFLVPHSTAHSNTGTNTVSRKNWLLGIPIGDLLYADITEILL
jgi:hypothetical protein